jgi:hypothetical protein
MRLVTLEELRHWQATVEYHGHHERQTICLLHSGVQGPYYWVIADYRGEKPWEALREYDADATASMVEQGRMRLIKGQWPYTVATILAQAPRSCGVAGKEIRILPRTLGKRGIEQKSRSETLG